MGKFVSVVSEIINWLEYFVMKLIFDVNDV